MGEGDTRRSRVTVVMPVYNHEAYLWSACRSVLEQDYDELQLVCVDDGSTDGSADVLAMVASQWPKERFVNLTQANAGAHAALNAGIGMTDSDVVMFINSDDYYADGRVSTCVRALESAGNPRRHWAFSAVAFIDESGQSVDPAEHGLPHYRDYMFHVAMGAWAPEILTWHNIVLTSGNLVIGRDLLEQTGDFADLRLAHDWDMALRLLARKDPIVIPSHLYLYRFHGTNTYRGLDQGVANRESAEVHRNWAIAVAGQQLSSTSALPYVARLRARRGLRAAWDGT